MERQYVWPQAPFGFLDPGPKFLFLLLPPFADKFPDSNPVELERQGGYFEGGKESPLRMFAECRSKHPFQNVLIALIDVKSRRS